MRRVQNRIAESFTVTANATELGAKVFSVIDQVHGVEGITALRFERRRLDEGWDGQFDPYSRTVSIAPTVPLPLCTGVHEIGHVLDALFLVSTSGSGGLQGPITYYASDYAASFGQGVLLDWFDAVTVSRPVRAFFNARFASRFGRHAYEQASYYVDSKEIWARSYLQFIAQNCRDVDLRTEFQVRRLDQDQIGGQKIRVYWTHEKFAPIERTMTTLFRSLGWM